MEHNGRLQFAGTPKFCRRGAGVLCLLAAMITKGIQSGEPHD